jgi:hypothetical protein
LEHAVQRHKVVTSEALLAELRQKLRGKFCLLQ